MSKLVYFKWTIDDTEVLKENLTPEQIGLFFTAVMDYVATGIIAEVPSDLKVLYADYRKRIDRAQGAYDQKCAKNAANGSKGGKAKAKNAKAAGSDKEAPPAKFKPPTRKQFYDAVEKQANEDEEYVMPDDYDIDCFFDSLDESGWQIGQTPIRCRQDWEYAISAKFFSNEDSPFYYAAFVYAFSTKDGLRDERGKSQADCAVYYFFQDYDGPPDKWRDSFDQYLNENY